MITPKFSFPVNDSQFTKSTHSQPGGIITRCVQVAVTPQGVAVRDSKDPDKETQYYTHEEWGAFVRGVKDGQFG